MVRLGHGRGRVSLLSPLLALSLVLAVAGSALAVRAPSQVDGPADPGAPGGPKVVIIVGPTGSLTAGFLREAEAAARIARRHSQNVHTFYTPHATWAAVKPALQGANIVIYLGHGNGWPSIYRGSLYRPTQNGLGLNPVAGGDNHTHRYYGEKYLAREVKLAPGAIVLLHHLCYAAGNSEPGLPEGPHGVAKQRVENYAAGWMEAGASAVVAEAYFGPAYYVRALFETKRSVEKIWRASPTFRGNVEAWASNRTDGATALIDPYVHGKRYGRSLVVRGAVQPTDLTGSPQDPGTEPPEAEAEPEFVWQPPLAGATLGSPLVTGPIVEGSSVPLSVPLELPVEQALPEGLLLTAEWWLLRPAVEPEGVAGAPQAVMGEPTESSAEIAPLAPEPVASVPVPTTVGEDGLHASIATPPLAGLYELRLTLGSADGGLLTDEPEGLTVEQVVHVARPLSAIIGLPEQLDVTAGSALSISVSVTNSGNIDWQQRPEDVLEERGPDPFAIIPPEQARLVGRLMRVDPALGPVELHETPVLLAEAPVAPGTMLQFELEMLAPEFSGEYVLVFDVETPSFGPLSASGTQPVALPLHVAPAPAPVATPGTD